MTNHRQYMERCLSLAEAGAGLVAPNPMVGCVIVHAGKIIGEGFHREFGGPHAEVNALANVNNPDLLPESTLYVSLEPCAHHGKTPPCADLIIEKKIPRVVVGTADPFPEVAGMGIARLKQAGIDVETGILENECRELNRRFITFHENKRPYVILKWAQTQNGFLDDGREGKTGPSVWISNSLSRRLVHRFRSQEAAVLVGTVTALKDDPSLTVRDWSGRNPLRVVLDSKNQLPRSLRLFDHRQMTLVFTGEDRENEENIEFEKISFQGNVPAQVLETLYHRNIQSLIVEGGAITLRGFLESDVWDEAHIFTSLLWFEKGTPAPELRAVATAMEWLDDDRLMVFRHYYKHL